MAISTSPPKKRWIRLHLNDEVKITAAQMAEEVDHGTHKVYVDEMFLYTVNVITKNTTLFCRKSTFEKAQPEKWQEIQAKIALQKLKDT